MRSAEDNIAPHHKSNHKNKLKAKLKAKRKVKPATKAAQAPPEAAPAAERSEAAYKNAADRREAAQESFLVLWTTPPLSRRSDSRK